MENKSVLSVIVLLTIILGLSSVPVKACEGLIYEDIEHKEKPDLVLMDIMMPVMDGREATRIIRSKKNTKNIPILATTAMTKKSQLRECIEAGCNDYIVKPFSAQELQEKILDFIPSAWSILH